MTQAICTSQTFLRAAAFLLFLSLFFSLLLSFPALWKAGVQLYLIYKYGVFSLPFEMQALWGGADDGNNS